MHVEWWMGKEVRVRKQKGKEAAEARGSGGARVGYLLWRGCGLDGWYQRLLGSRETTYEV